MKTLEALQLSKHEYAFLEKVRKTVHKVLPHEPLILFGSRVRGEAGPESDWDILILPSRVTSELKHRIRAVLYDIELEEGVVINPLILPKVEWEKGRFRDHPIHRRIDEEGVLV
jgi:predicted nucleotidyltransferase